MWLAESYGKNSGCSVNSGLALGTVALLKLGNVLIFSNFRIGACYE